MKEPNLTSSPSMGATSELGAGPEADKLPQSVTERENQLLKQIQQLQREAKSIVKMLQHLSAKIQNGEEIRFRYTVDEDNKTAIFSFTTSTSHGSISVITDRLNFELERKLATGETSIQRWSLDIDFSTAKEIIYLVYQAFLNSYRLRILHLEDALMLGQQISKLLQ